MNTENLIETNDSGILWQTFSLPSSCPGENVFCRLAQPQTPFRGIVQISHGMCEYIDRYLPFFRFLAKEGFVVLPYMNPDLNVARDLQNAGAAAVMPLASPIGSNKGLATKAMIQVLIGEIDLPIIVDAGIGKPSQACEAMEMGAAAIMANTAIATAGDVPEMAAAFKLAIEAGRKAYLTGMGRVLARGGSASDPLTGFLR